MLTLIASLRERGYDVELVIGNHGTAEKVEREFGVRSHYIQSFNWIVPISKKVTVQSLVKIQIKKWYNLYAEIRLYKFIKGCQPDIVVINSSDQYVGIKACRWLGIPVIMHFREFMTLDHGSRYWSEKFAKKQMMKLDGGIAISQDIKQYFSKYSIQNLETIYNGVDIQKYSLPKVEKTEGFFNISCIGKLCDGKNQLLALKATTLLLKRGIRNFHIYFYGDRTTEYANYLREYAGEKGIGDYITFAGEINNIGQLYLNTHINLLCSRSEAFGRVIIEGMMNRCLSIVTNAGGAKEIVKDRYNGLLFENDNEQSLCDELFYAINNYRELSVVIEQGYRDAIEKFSAEANVNNIEGYLQKICKQKGWTIPV